MKLKIKSFTKYYILLFSIIILFVILNIINSNNALYIDLRGIRTKGTEEIVIKENNEYYLSYSYIKEYIDEEIYFDNVSKKIVISSNEGIFKIKINDKDYNINFDEKSLTNVGVIEKEGKYISLEMLSKAYNLEITVQKNVIYIYDNTQFDCKIKSNNVPMYIKGNIKSKIVDYVDKKEKILGLFEKDNTVFVKIGEDKVGYISKKLLKYSTGKKEEENVKEKFKAYIFADASNTNIDKNLPITGVFVNMFEVTRTSPTVNVKNINSDLLNNINKNGYKLYGVVTNGYNLASFTSSTMSQILADESKRLELINNLDANIKKYDLKGIMLDFRRLRENDIDNYIQFVKELEAFSKKKVIVNIDANEYKNYAKIINYSDFSILNAYGQRDLTSTVSGSVSEIRWMKDIIYNTLKVANPDKLVVGIPAYSILWIEKNSNVIDSEIYNLNAVEDYIKNNNLEKKEVSGQNYVELKKGSLVYRMWLEDEVSVKNRLKIIEDNKLAGVAIYKLGYENDTLISILKNVKKDENNK